MLAAGLEGVEEELPLADPVEDLNLYSASEDELAARGIGMLPENLGQAIELFAQSKLMRETLGEHIHSYLVKAKRREWMEYERYVSQWELDRYLAVL